MNSTPVDLLLQRLEGTGAKPRRSGRGWLCRCPAHEDRSASLSIAEAEDGRALLHCFAGCQAVAVVHVLGLQVADLFPPKPADVSPAGRAQQREAHRQAGWAAALNVLAREALIVQLAARTIVEGQPLSAEDWARLDQAIARIDDARLVLAP